MKLANIIYDDELVNHTHVDYVNYINEPTEYDSIDKSLPTMYVGWKLMKKSNPTNPTIQNVDILIREVIPNKLYWEFSYNENKPSHIKGVNQFAEQIFQMYFTPKYVYVGLDPIFSKIRSIDDMMSILPKEIQVMYCYRNDMIYLLCDDHIWGIDLKIYKYFLFNTDEIKERLSLQSTMLYDDIGGEIYSSKHKIFSEFIHLKRYMVVILKESTNI